MLVQFVRFRSALSDDAVLEKYRARAPRYRELSGLVQKYYLKFPATDEYGAVYVWESEAALAAFHASALAKTIAAAYEVQGAPQVETAEVEMTLRSA